MPPPPIRARIRRLYIPNALYFITAVTHHRKPIFADEPNIHLLRETMRRVKQLHLFKMQAYAILPDHLHLLIHVCGPSNISTIMHSIKRNFVRNYKRERGITESLHLWQRGFWDHVIRDEEDLAHHFHYIHYNPVKHGCVTRPEDYAHSSFHEYLERGWYTPGWGHTEPEAVQGLDFE